MESVVKVKPMTRPAQKAGRVMPISRAAPRGTVHPATEARATRQSMTTSQ
jgi:hypothetical protein